MATAVPASGRRPVRSLACIRRYGAAAGAPRLVRLPLRGQDYSPTYCAAFVIDPDGNNVEAVLT